MNIYPRDIKAIKRINRLFKSNVSANEGNEDALAVLLRSSIVQYYLFFQKTKNIPWGFSSEQIRELSNLQKEMAQSLLDEEVQRILKIPKNIGILASDFNIRLKPSLANAQPTEHDLLKYGSSLRDELDAFTDGGGLRHKVKLTHSEQLVLCSVEFIKEEPAQIEVTVEEDQGDLSLFLDQRFIFEDSIASFCKRPRLIDWTRTQALNDSDDIISEILCKQKPSCL